MGPRQRFFPLVRSNRGYRRGACIRHIAPRAIGAGESVSYPACSTILSRYFPEHKRGFANASIVAGMALGPAFGTLAGGILMSRFGWRPVFLVVGLTSLLWLLP